MGNWPSYSPAMSGRRPARWRRRWRRRRAELLVGERGGLLDAREGDDLRGLEPIARDREVLDGALRLRAVQGVLGDAHLTHRVVLDAVLDRVGHFVVPFGGCRVARRVVVDAADDDVGHGGAFGESVVRADDCERPSATASLMSSDGAAARRRCRAGARARRSSDGRALRRRASRALRTAGTIGAIWRQMCGGSAGASALRLSIAARTAPHSSWPSTTISGTSSTATAYSRQPMTESEMTCRRCAPRTGRRGPCRR